MTNRIAIPFTVDSALLRELGERLVGRQYIALAELIKNSYDADATKVIVKFEEERIEITDNGHGMRFEDFQSKWMRVGSPHKQKQARSPGFGRSLTGSKGIGRLATQFLADELFMVSTPDPEAFERDGDLQETSNSGENGAKSSLDSEEIKELSVVLNWSDAVQAGELTKAEALYELEEPHTIYPGISSHGTMVVLTGLKQEWDQDDFEELAREIWYLQPPFEADESAEAFEVELVSPFEELAAAFKIQMHRILDLWTARVVGELQDGTMQLSIDMAPSGVRTWQVELPIRDNWGSVCLINSLSFEFRVFDLIHRQPYGIPVAQARDYMNRFGGIHVYDSGFRIPFSGPAADWLRVEFDHAHRLSRSQLLPQELQVIEGLNDLPTNSRLWGAVRISTAEESRVATGKRDHLDIQVSRDRLMENDAYHQLVDAVRYALDLYATQRAAARVHEFESRMEVASPAEHLEQVSELLGKYAAQLPAAARRDLASGIEAAIQAARDKAELTARQVGLLSSLATAGIASLAFDHELNQQLTLLDARAENMVSLSPAEAAEQVHALGQDLKRWIGEVRETRKLFSHLSDERNREAFERFRARPLLDDLKQSMRPLLRGAAVDTTGIHATLRLPLGGYPEWVTIFQNVLLNSVNAMVDSEQQEIGISSFVDGKDRTLFIQDTGAGVDLNRAEEFFKPFTRETVISPQRANLGYGGTGLGLTIVRMVATELNVTVHFVEPDPEFATCLEISWRER